MRHGKDVLLDKPGMTTLDQLAEVRRVQAETGRIVSILYSEHFEVPATVRAGELVAAGAIGEVVHVIGLGPHRLRKATPAGLVLRPRAVRRHPDRHRLAPGRAVPVLHRRRRRRVLSATRREPRQPRHARAAGRRRHAPRHRHRDRHDPRRLVHPGRPADLGRRAADHRRHRGHDRAPQVRRRRRPGRQRPPVPDRQGRACGTSTAPAPTCRSGGSSWPTSATAPRRRCRRRAASRRWRSR